MVMKIQKGMRRKYMNTLSRALLPLLRERESVSKYRGVMSGLAFELDRILIWFGLRVHTAYCITYT